MNTGIKNVAGLKCHQRLWCPKSSKKKKKKKERKLSFKNNSSGFLKNKDVS